MWLQTRASATSASAVVTALSLVLSVVGVRLAGIGAPAITEPPVIQSLEPAPVLQVGVEDSATNSVPSEGTGLAVLRSANVRMEGSATPSQGVAAVSPGGEALSATTPVPPEPTGPTAPPPASARTRGTATQ